VEAGKKVATLLGKLRSIVHWHRYTNFVCTSGTDTDLLYDNFVRPKIKVGAEWVIKGQNTAQANNSVAGIARAIFERQFRYLVSKCNETLVDPTMRRLGNFLYILISIWAGTFPLIRDGPLYNPIRPGFGPGIFWHGPTSFFLSQR